MSDAAPSLQDVWRLLGRLNRRIKERFDIVEQRLVAIDARTHATERHVAAVEAGISAQIEALNEAIKASTARLNDHSRRLTKLDKLGP